MSPVLPVINVIPVAGILLRSNVQSKLQRKHARMVGWFPTKQIEGNIAKGNVLIAEEQQAGGTGVSPVPEMSTGGTPVPPRSKKEPRIHIFWQRRIREGDNETPYWFPSETTGGALKENRLVLPIPPGTHWSDAKPAVLPGIDEAMKALPLPGAGAEVEKKPRARNEKPKVVKSPSGSKGGLWFSPPPPAKGSPEAKAAEKEKKPKAPKMKNDPKLVAAARELRDRYIEQINAPGAPGLLLPPSACGKYDVSRQLEASPTELKQMPLLEAA